MISRRSCIYLFFLVPCLGWQGCSHRALDEARQVVAEADSLWHEGKMYGIDEGDSLSLAQAYETLGKYSAFYSFVHRTSSLGTYAHACYHYGRLLREKNDPVSAMQVFIDATHSRTDDLHILGRVYSNMGNLCHLAGDFALAYNMYKHSAEKYLENGDSILYYYDIVNMAYETAVMKDTVQTKLLLDSIQKFGNQDVIIISQEARATMHMHCKQYNAVISVVDSMQVRGYHMLPGYLMKAQAFEHLGQMDSAIYYAQQLISLTTDNRYLISAYYILYNDDNEISSDSILELSSARADAQKAWAQENGQLAKASKLLEVDLDKYPDLRWLYAVIGTILVVWVFLFVYVRRKRSKHQLLTQEIEELTEIHQSAALQHQQSVVQHAQYLESQKEKIEQNCILMVQSDMFPNNLRWGDFHAMSDIVNSNMGMLATKLQGIYSLSEREVRLCVLVLLNITGSKQLASMLFYSESGIRNFKNRTAKKLNTNSVDLRKTLLNIAVGEQSKE